MATKVTVTCQVCLLYRLLYLHILNESQALGFCPCFYFMGPTLSFHFPPSSYFYPLRICSLYFVCVCVFVCILFVICSLSECVSAAVTDIFLLHSPPWVLHVLSWLRSFPLGATTELRPSVSPPSVRAQCLAAFALVPGAILSLCWNWGLIVKLR